MQKLITAIEFSPSGINLVTGYTFQGKVYILNSLVNDSLNTDINGYLEKTAAIQAVSEMIQKDKEMLHREDLGSFICLLPPDDFLVKEYFSTYATLHDEVGLSDYKNACLVIKKKALQEGYNFIYADPFMFSGDGYSSHEFPLGKNITTLTVNFDSHFISKVSYDYYQKIIKDSGIPSPLMLVSSFGIASYLNGFKETGGGYVNVDVEKNHTYVSYVKDKRLISSKFINMGVDHAINVASEKLSTSFERMSELAEIFGLRDNAGFAFKTKEKYSLDMIAEALKNGFAPIIKEIQDALASMQIEPNLIYILSGIGLNVDGFDIYLSNCIRKRFHFLKDSVIGARKKNLLPCLGAICLTMQSYMDYLDNGRQNSSENEFVTGQFTRG